MREKLNALQTLSYAMTEDEDVDVEEIVAGVIEYLDEEGLLKRDTFHDQTDEENRTSDLSPVTGADGREFY